jgi:hypothetical protein
VARYPDWVLGAGAALISLVLYAYLPSLGLAVYASPDETGNAVAAEQLALQGQASLTEPEAVAFPWLHPRSWVSQGETIVPVGFLGLPWLASWPVRVFGPAVLPWLGAILFASAALPLFYLLRRFGQLQAFLGTLVAMTMPNVILYGNRGLFPNAPLVAFVVWGVWLSSRKDKKTIFIILAGLAWALALAIRPVEGVWILPWLIWSAVEGGWKRREWLVAGASALLVGGLVELSVHATYGQWLVIGYWLRDNPITALRQAYEPILSTVRLTPFGIHPVNIARNAVGFLGGLLAPWTVLGLAALTAVFLRFRQRVPTLVWLCLWTAGWLIFFYGNGRYLDHIVPGAMTVGNSYLRYLLPLAPLLGLAFAWLSRDVIVGKGARPVFILIAAALILGGVHRAFIADDEGVWYTRRELARYDKVRQAALQAFGPGSVVFSERSDKIFFPVMRGVSPEPSVADMAQLIRSQKKDAGWFTRPPTQGERDAWLRYGIEVQDAGNFGRENLYRLVPRP